MRSLSRRSAEGRYEDIGNGDEKDADDCKVVNQFCSGLVAYHVDIIARVED